MLVVLGTAAFGGLGLLLAGTVRAEVTLAAANLVWLVLLFAGGIAIPLSKYPHGVAQVLQYLPSAALSDGLHRVLQNGAGIPVHDRADAAGLGARSRCPPPRGGSGGSEHVASVAADARSTPPVRWLPAARADRSPGCAGSRWPRSSPTSSSS